MTARLQVMICTHGADGLDRVSAMSLPKVDGIGYLVSCQSTPRQLPSALVRDDIQVIFTDSIGLSNNRNNALDAVTAPYALIADDDLVYTADGLKAALAAFDEHPDVDIFTFRADFPTPKIYPPGRHDISVPYKGYIISSVEIGIRVSAIRKAGVRFSPYFGIGAPYLHSSEENVFIRQCLAHGLRGQFLPITVTAHPGLTTAEHSGRKPGVQRAAGAYIWLYYPALEVIPRLLLKAWRTGGNILLNLVYLTQGAIYAQSHKKEIR